MSQTKVLIIEDDYNILEELQETLTLIGYDVAYANNGLAGLEQAFSFLPDIVVSDVMLPGLDGYEILFELRSDERTAEIPFIFLTARVENKDYRYAMQLGADDYLTKPFTFKELCYAIDSCLEHKQQMKAKRQSELEQIRDQLEAQQHHNLFSAEFLSMLVHDMKNPLTTIISSASILSIYFDKLSPERCIAHVNHIIRSAHNTVDMIEDMMTFGKFEAGILAINPQWISLPKLVNNIIDSLWHEENRTHDIIVNTDLLTHIQIFVDERLIYRAILNLITNAIKYSAQGTRIQITLVTCGDMSEISIRDEGIGIPEKDQAKLFESFERATNVGTISGTGLGLAVVKLTSELHRGTIRCESVEGQGSTFTLSIPIELTDASLRYSQQTINPY